MTRTLAPISRLVRVRSTSTGECDECWPVDARERVASGGWVYDLPATPAPAPVVAHTPPPEPTIDTVTDALSARPVKALRALANQLGIPVATSRAQLVADVAAAALPHVLAGTFALDTFTLTPPSGDAA